VGVATFLPIDSIISKPINEKYRNFHSGARFVLDVLQYESSFERIFQFVCNNTLVCDNLGVARTICYDRSQNVKAITLDGSVIHKGGLITGGQSDSTLSSAKSWEAKEVQRLQKTKERLEEELKSVDRNRRELRTNQSIAAQLSTLSDRKKFVEEDLDATNRKLASIDGEMKSLKAFQSDLKNAFEGDRSKLEDLGTSKLELEQSIKTVEDKVFGSFCQALGVDSIQEFELDRLRREGEIANIDSRFADQESRLGNEFVQVDSPCFIYYFSPIG
jgi:structural maintenance of chromosome 1